jgi:hypothetical protein
MNKKLIGLTMSGLVLFMLLAASCQKTAALPLYPEPFTASYTLGGSVRSISISGNGRVMPGEQAQYMLKVNNNDQPWLDEYAIQLTSNGALIQEVYRGQLNLHGNDGLGQLFTVNFPKGVAGSLGLSFVDIQSGATLTENISIGLQDTTSPPTTMVKTGS